VTDAPDNHTPSLDELDRIAFDAAVRSAPRFGRFVGTGAFVGVALGFVLGFALPNSTNVGRGVVGLLLAIGFGMVGVIVVGAIVTRVDDTRKAPSGPLPWDLTAPSGPLPWEQTAPSGQVPGDAGVEPPQTFAPAPVGEELAGDDRAEQVSPYAPPSVAASDASDPENPLPRP